MSERTEADAAKVDVLVAARVVIGICTTPGCDCHGMSIQLVDEGGRLFATAPLSPEVARAVSVDLLEAAEQIDKRRVQN